jgi:transketolase N-terminal domain/subunit
MIFIEIRCDKCQIVGISRACFFAHQLRKELKAQGWKYIEAGGKDFCPKHKPRRKPRRRSRTTVVLVNSERKTERG